MAGGTSKQDNKTVIKYGTERTRKYHLFHWIGMALKSNLSATYTETGTIRPSSVNQKFHLSVYLVEIKKQNLAGIFTFFHALKPCYKGHYWS